MRRSFSKYRFMAAAIAFFVQALESVHAGEWIVDAKSGCKVWNPNPSTGETATWSGPCVSGVAQGKGLLDWGRSGAGYERDEGEWRAGRQVGEGLQTWRGGRYKGQLMDGLPHGQGSLTIGQTTYEGAFLNGKPNGRGVLTNPSGVFDGSWNDGCFNDGKRRAALGVSVQTCH